ncbi:hypothetical protein RYX36_008363 [Vicia faba]
MKKQLVCGMAVVIVAILLFGEVSYKLEALSCSPIEFNPCFVSFTSSSLPTSYCCRKQREQRPCFCSYIKNPSLKHYILSPGARRIAISCGIPVPTSLHSRVDFD